MFTDNNGIKLISDALCHKSHSVRIIVREKDIISKNGFEDRVTYYTPDNVPSEYAADGGLPTFIDRDIEINNAVVVAEYLDDRYPHPPLLPVYPIERVKCRSLIQRVCIGWTPQINRLMKKEANKEQRKEFADSIITFSQYFDTRPYFITEDFTLADAFLIPVLWRLGEMDILLPQHRKTRGLIEYMQRMFKRPSVVESFSDLEKEFTYSLMQ